MAINKVVYGGSTLIDLTGDTLTDAAQLVNGIKAHTRAGAQITGTFAGLDPSDVLLHILKNSGNNHYKTASFTGSNSAINTISVTVGFKPKIIIVKNNSSIYSTSNSTPYTLLSSFTICDDSYAIQDKGSSFILKDTANNNRAQGGFTSKSYFEPTSNGFAGVGTNTKVYSGTYDYFCWG